MTSNTEMLIKSFGHGRAYPNPADEEEGSLEGVRPYYLFSEEGYEVWADDDGNIVMSPDTARDVLDALTDYVERLDCGGYFDT